MALQWIRYRNPIAHGDDQLAHSQPPGSGLLVMGSLRSTVWNTVSDQMLNKWTAIKVISTTNPPSIGSDKN